VPAGEGQLLWEPSEEMRGRSEMGRFIRERGFGSYDELWRWSVEDLEGFWGALWERFEVRASKPYERVLERREMPGAKWFPGAELNYAEHVFRMARPAEPAIVHASESSSLEELSWDELGDQVARAAAGLRRLGVERGDRVVAYMPNVPETVVAFLAAASIGAVWSSCAPEFGVPTVIDRFAQIEPKVLIAIEEYTYGGRRFDRRDKVRELERAIPSLEHTVLVPGGWDELLAEPAPLQFEQVPFDHPLWVLYSSGTTGLPKAIVQGQGGILLEHLKKSRLHSDLSPGDRFFWFTTTGWMMWNFLVGGLLSGSAIVLYDGQPDPHGLWGFAAEAGVTCFGTSAGFIGACMKAGARPGRDHDLSRLRSLGSTGSPLPVEGFEWVYEQVKRDLWLFSTSGGTDLCTAFVGGSPVLPVRAGELQARCLGAAVQAFDEEGRPVVGELGELVITEPMPSMPLFFWNDPGGARYRESYFDTYPGVWRHGDWIKITPQGGAVIYGRSDSTINRGGVRMGTSEIYSAVEGVPDVLDSLVVDVDSLMSLFVVLREDAELDEELEDEIRRRIREHCSPRHVPDQIVRVPEVPRTLSGKKLEVPVKKILMGTPAESAASRDSLANPDALDHFVGLASAGLSPGSSSRPEPAPSASGESP
jgi:acetoacetyl-CoA synthetase